MPIFLRGKGSKGKKTYMKARIGYKYIAVGRAAYCTVPSPEGHPCSRLRTKRFRNRYRRRRTTWRPRMEF